MECSMLTCLISVITLCFLYILIKKLFKTKLPPGPTGLPILGSYFQLEPRAYLAFNEMKKKYGDVFSIKIGFTNYIVLASYKSIKEALIDKNENFSGRPKDQFMKEISKNSGIVHIDGAIWQNYRKFSLQTLRDFGLGRNLSSEIILNEWDILRQKLDSIIGAPINTMDLLSRTVTNIICTMTFGEQPGYDPNDDFGNIFAKMKQTLSTPLMKLPPTMFPQLYYIYPLMKKLPAVKNMLNNAETIQNYIHKKIEDHKQSFDPDAEPRDFTDAYLREQMKDSLLKKSESTFTNWQLIETIFEMFGAGTATTANSLVWAFFWMSMKTDLQRKVQKEIDENLGDSQSISYNDRSKLNLVQAVLDEVQRWVTIVPYSMNHRNFRADTIQGHQIPADSNIIPCLYTAHHDPTIWEKPDEFYPQHFLSDDGEHYQSRNELIPFSIGRRSCLGESLARMEYFILFTSIIRRYRLTLDPVSNSDLSNIMMGSDGPMRSPGLHKIVLKIRD